MDLLRLREIASLKSNIIQKGKKYIRPGQKAPKGVQLHKGPRNGYFYYTVGLTSNKSKPDENIMEINSPDWKQSEFKIISGRAKDKNAVFRASSKKGYHWANYDAGGNRISQGDEDGPMGNKPTDEELKQWDAKAKIIANNVDEIGISLDRPLFIRYGRIPKDGKSKNYASGEYEKGTSAYRGDYDPDTNSFKIADNSGLSGASLLLERAGKTAYLMNGDEIGLGSDSEPILNNPQIIGQLIRDTDGNWKLKRL